MKKLLLFALYLLLVFSAACAADSPAEPIAPTEDFSVLYPLPQASVSEGDSLEDGIYSVGFDPNELVYQDGGYTLKLNLFAYDLYDAVEVQSLEKFESIIVCNERIGIEAVNILPSGLIEINDGLGEGICLMPHEGGTYRTVTYNDYPLYFPIGSVTLPVSENVQVIDLSRHDETAGITDESLYPKDAIFGYAELDQALTDKTLWWAGATTARIEDGKIANIKRIWTP